MLTNRMRKSIPDQVMNEILEAISSGEIKPGERLPSEHELCELFGVSRPSVKTAIDRLNLLGIVEQKVGDGTYVKDTEMNDFFAVYADFFMKPQEIPQLLQLELALEKECLCHLADSQRAELQNILQTLTDGSPATAAATAVPPEALVEAALHFHARLCEHPQNRYFAQLHSMLVPALRTSLTSASEKQPALLNYYLQLYRLLGEQDDKSASLVLNALFTFLSQTA